MADDTPDCPLDPHVNLGDFSEPARRCQQRYPASLADFAITATRLGLPPPAFALLLDTVERSDRTGTQVEPLAVWASAVEKHELVMRRSILMGERRKNPTHFLEGDWAMRLRTRPSVLGPGGTAMRYAIAIQEYNASMGLVSAAPTGGASGTVPGALIAMGEYLKAPLGRQVEALLVAGLVGRVAAGRGPISGAQAGCGGEIGVASCMAAAGVAWLLGGDWVEIGAAAALAGSLFVGLECSPTFGLVEYPCVPRNGFGALVAIGAAEQACAGIVPPYDADGTLDRIFAVGAALHARFRETNTGHWVSGRCERNACQTCH